MTHRSTLALALALMSLICFSAAGESIAPGIETPPSVDPTISNVATGGRWFEGDQVGTYRLLVKTIAAGQRNKSLVYLEWLIYDANMLPTAVLQTRPIIELNRRDEIEVYAAQYQGHPPQFEILYDIRNGEAPGRALILLERRPGKYRVQDP